MRRHLSVDKSYPTEDYHHHHQQHPHQADPYSGHNQRLGGHLSGRRYGGSSDHVPGMMLGPMGHGPMLPSYQQQPSSMGPYGLMLDAAAGSSFTIIHNKLL
jgi:hypothetical protein